MEVIAEANDAVFTLDTDIASMNIKNIRWYLDGQLVLEGANADSLLLEEVAAGGTLDVELVFLDDCVQMATKSFDISQIQSVYIPNMMDLSGTARAPDNAWTVYVKGDQTIVLGVRIYDRWGNKVRDFENTERNYFKELLIWDGFFGSGQAEQGVYTYVMQLEMEGSLQIKRGSITVLR